ADARARRADALVKQLGDGDYKTRKQAFRALEQMGADARGALEKAMKSDDAEVRWSASLLVDRIDENSTKAAKAGAPSGALKPRDEANARSGADADDDENAQPQRGRGSLDELQMQMREMTRRMQELQRRFGGGAWPQHDPFDFDLFRGFDGQGGSQLE